MALPAPEDATKWYNLAATIFEGIVAPGTRSRKRRYHQLKALYDLLSDVYIDYAEMFAEFERALPTQVENSEKYLLGNDFVAASEVSSIVKKAKGDFDDARKKLSTERLLWKNTAAGWFRAASDKREQHFLFAAFWFLEYRDDYVKSPLKNDRDMDHKIAIALEKGGSAAFDSPSIFFSRQVLNESDPAKLRTETKRMQLHINELFRFVVQNFRLLEDEWNPASSSNSE